MFYAILYAVCSHVYDRWRLSAHNLLCLLLFHSCVECHSLGVPPSNQFFRDGCIGSFWTFVHINNTEHHCTYVSLCICMIISLSLFLNENWELGSKGFAGSFPILTVLWSCRAVMSFLPHPVSKFIWPFKLQLVNLKKMPQSKVWGLAPLAAGCGWEALQGLPVEVAWCTAQSRSAVSATLHQSGETKANSQNKHFLREQCVCYIFFICLWWLCQPHWFT